MSLPLPFPAGFLWGAATSAHQVEGGNTLNDWWRFEQLPGVISGGRGSGEACRHWELFDADFARAAADGHNAHRLSLEWSRLEPAPGQFDPGAVAHYHAVLAEHVTAYDPATTAILGRIQAGMAAVGADAGTAYQRALKLLDLSVLRQAAVLAYNHVFELVTVLFLLSLPLVFLLARNVRGSVVEVVGE